MPTSRLVVPFGIAILVATVLAAQRERGRRRRHNVTATFVIPQRVLVVDDNTDATEMMAALLNMHGHDVWIAHDAEQALAVANEVVPDVALLDIGLPGLDGYELARRLRQGDATRDVRLVAVTGWGQDGDRARARDAGFDAHLTKPAESGLILSAVAPEESDDDVARRA